MSAAVGAEQEVMLLGNPSSRPAPTCVSLIHHQGAQTNVPVIKFVVNEARRLLEPCFQRLLTFRLPLRRWSVALQALAVKRHEVADFRRIGAEE